MADVFIKYNPYKEETTIEINGVRVTSDSKLSYALNHRLQEWIEPRANWRGIFKELREDTADRQIQISFYGTQFDFADLSYARDKYGDVFDKVSLIHENEKSSVLHNQANKLEELKKLYNELLNGPIEEFKAEDIQQAFEAAISSDFEIVVVAPMSSGKSTLINAILGQDLLPAVNEATTAVITRIRDNDMQKQFLVTAHDHNGDLIKFLINEDGSFAEDANGNYILSPDGKEIKDLEATSKLISQLNYLKDSSDSEGKRALVDETYLEGQIEAIPSDKINTVFVDTPGGNNAQNDEHRDLMEAAIENENKSIILYVFNGTQTGTYDSDAILKLIAEEMRRSRNGKQSRDRFLFVANRMDDFDPEKEDYSKYIKNTILPELAKHGITEPQLFLVSARLAKLIRVRRSGQAMTKQDRSWLSGKGVLFGRIEGNDTNYCLYQHSSISNQLKSSFEDRVMRIVAEHPEFDDPESEYWDDELAEINSGVPALESAIRDYVEKYAICIKINDAHEKFMRKVREREMINACEEKWASSKDELEKAREELANKRKRRDESKKLAEFSKRIDDIKLDENPILAHETGLRRDFDRMVQSILAKGNTRIKADSAETILAEFRRKAESTMTKAQRDLIDLINQGAVQQCDNIVKEYSAYVRSLEDGGFFSLGGVNVKKLDGFQNFDIESVEDMLSDDSYVYSETVEAGTRTYKKSGIFNFFRRIFGTGGYETETIYKEVDMLKIDELLKDKMTEILADFSANSRKARDEAKESIKEVKRIANGKLRGIDKIVEDAIAAVEASISDEEKLKKRVAENESNSKWIKDYVSRVDAILDI